MEVEGHCCCNWNEGGVHHPGARHRGRGLALLLAIACALPVSVGGVHAAAPAITVQISPATIRQGMVVVVQVFGAPAGSRLRVGFAGRTSLLYGRRTHHIAYLGTDPATAPGRRTITIEGITPNGSRLLASRAVTVSRVTFPVRRITLDPAREALLDPRLAQEERRKVASALRVLHASQLWEHPFATPVRGRLTSRYGVLSVYQGQVRGFHRGVDFAAPTGTVVYAANHGIVRLAGTLPLSGNAVLIDHGLGIVTSYLHLSAVVVRAGQKVRRGQVIGRVGSTGLSTGPHLHWGLRTNGVHVDPLSWTAR